MRHLFSIKELEELDEKQLAILEAVILREIQTSPQIREMLRKKIKAEVYDPWLAKKERRKPK
jgi:hypothetical protein